MLVNPMGDGGSSSSTNKIKKNNKSRKKSVDNKKEGFFDILLSTEKELSEKELKILIDSILNNGNKFVRSPTPKNLRDYKQAIKEYLKKIEKFLIKVKEDVEIDGQTPRIHVVAEIVDQKINDITEMIMKKEKNTISFASRVEEINGLLLDLYM